MIEFILITLALYLVYRYGGRDTTVYELPYYDWWPAYVVEEDVVFSGDSYFCLSEIPRNSVLKFRGYTPDGRRWIEVARLDESNII